jgi:hypothetical protein
MKLRFFTVVVALASGCALGEWRSTPAERPLSHRELASWDVTVTSADKDLANVVAQAMASQGFKVVTHPPYHEELELTLKVQQAPEGLVAVATLRSDDFFVDEVRAKGTVGDAAAEVARTLAGSQAMADFVRNSGLPQQTNLSPQ